MKMTSRDDIEAAELYTQEQEDVIDHLIYECRHVHKWLENI